jgi:hypothetical protein
MSGAMRSHLCRLRVIGCGQVFMDLWKKTAKYGVPSKFACYFYLLQYHLSDEPGNGYSLRFRLSGS